MYINFIHHVIYVHESRYDQWGAPSAREARVAKKTDAGEEAAYIHSSPVY